MKKSLLMLVCCVSLFSLAAYASAVEIIIHDDGPAGPNDPYGPGYTKDKTECLYIVEAEDGNIVGSYGLFGVPGDGNCHLWLYDGSSVTVTCPEPTDVVYVQSSGSDSDDGYADYYVDDVLVASVQTYMRGNWYLEIKGLEETAHTVTVVSRGGVVNLNYFGFGNVPTYVDVDIKPGSCPNPLNVNEKCPSVLPVAILGTEDFDVSNIHVASIRLAGVAPRCVCYEDVASPVLDPQDDCDCTTNGADGVVDLALKFNKQEIIEAIGDVDDGDILQLILTGSLIDGTKIEGSDCVKIIDKTPKKHKCCPHHGKCCSHHKNCFKMCSKNCKKYCK